MFSKETILLLENAVLNQPIPNAISNKGIEQLQQKLSLGELSYLDFLKLSSIIIDGAISELEMLNSYNQTVIKYNYLTTNFFVAVLLFSVTFNI